MFDFKTKYKTLDGGIDGISRGDHKEYASVTRILHVKSGNGFAQEQIRLTREQAAHVAAELTRWLEATAPVDPAYEAYAAASAAAIPATDDEWKGRLVEGGVA